MIYVGVDPGVNGAIVVINDAGGLLVARKMPTVASGKRRRGSSQRVDPVAVCSFLESLNPYYSLDAFVVIEEVAAGPMTSRHSVHVLAESAALVEGVAVGFGFRVARVRPQVWQLAMLRASDSGSTKDAATARALELWPTLAGALRLKKDQGIADAALLAEFARTRLTTTTKGT